MSKGAGSSTDGMKKTNTSTKMQDAKTGEITFDGSTKQSPGGGSSSKANLDGNTGSKLSTTIASGASDDKKGNTGGTKKKGAGNAKKSTVKASNTSKASEIINLISDDDDDSKMPDAYSSAKRKNPSQLVTSGKKSKSEKFDADSNMDAAASASTTDSKFVGKNNTSEYSNAASAMDAEIVDPSREPTSLIGDDEMAALEGFFQDDDDFVEY
ncbi:unnamed protein product [Amoebophrya sp. A25]|nr:unnamed protein product [Amoebophrya sp. A25]|eukprot:GSA25T00027910001.1